MNQANLKETVEIFKTNVTSPEAAAWLAEILKTLFPRCRINFDLQDCDRILRIQGDSIETSRVVSVLKMYHYECVPFES